MKITHKCYDCKKRYTIHEASDENYGGRVYRPKVGIIWLCKKCRDKKMETVTTEELEAKGKI